MGGFIIAFSSAQAQLENYDVPFNTPDALEVPSIRATGYQKTTEVLFEALDEAFDMATFEMEIKGMSASLITPDGEIWERAAGVSQEEPMVVPLTTDHLMGIASNTKSYVAATILLMVEDGLLNLDDPIDMYLDSIPNTSGDATIRQLLSMRTGFSDYLNDNDQWIIDLFADTDSIWAFEGLLETYLLEPNFEIDEDWGYSNTNYLLAGMVIEAVSGNAWYTEVRNRVLDPMGLEETYIFPFEQPTDLELAHCWTFDPDGNFGDAFTILDPDGFFSVVTSAGCIISTAEDLARFRQTLHGEDFLQEATYAEMSNNYSPEIPSLSYGLGILSDLFYPQENWGHTGSWVFQSTSRYFPEYDFSLVTIQNDSRYPDESLNLLILFETLKEVYINYDISLSVDELSDTEINIYPNPSIEVLNIDFDGSTSDLKLMDVLGNTVKIDLELGSNSLDGLAEGQYILTGLAGGAPFSRRVVVLK